jgi:hypothetical protein
MAEGRQRKFLAVCLLSDGLPGHGNQARGLVHWLRSRYDVEVVELEVRLRWRSLARLLSPLLLGWGARGGNWFEVSIVVPAHRAKYPI